MSHQRYIRADDCPVCGKEDGARCGSTEWGHSVSVCSRKCGKRYKIWLNLGKAKNTTSVFCVDPDFIVVSGGGGTLYLSQSKICLRNTIKRLRHKLCMQSKAEEIIAQLEATNAELYDDLKRAVPLREASLAKDKPN